MRQKFLGEKIVGMENLKLNFPRFYVDAFLALIVFPPLITSTNFKQIQFSFLLCFRYFIFYIRYFKW